MRGVSKVSLIFTGLLVFPMATLTAGPAPNQGGNLAGVAQQVFNNPCGGPQVNGSVGYTTGVRTEEEEGVFAFFRANSSTSNFTDINGDQFVEYASASATYSTQSPQSYTFPIRLVLQGQGSAAGKSFVLYANVIVTVGANQQPLSVSLPGVAGVCGPAA